jgi:hypothetical protein
MPSYKFGAYSKTLRKQASFAPLLVALKMLINLLYKLFLFKIPFDILHMVLADVLLIKLWMFNLHQSFHLVK